MRYIKAHKEQTIRFRENAGISASETEVKDSEFCKKSVCDLIIEKGEYASHWIYRE
ncbi:MAG: hypothetical protein VB078_08215 [Clostridiaceae bacterium]|nr:hypothetical protein [Clostridiaceae bacterium]